MALESVLDIDPGLGDGGLVIWIRYGTLVDTAEWFVDYDQRICDRDTDQTDTLDELFVQKKGWKGTAAEQYQFLYDVFLEQLYRPFFEAKLCNIKGITLDAEVGAAKLMNQCDDFYLSLESGIYEPEIRTGRPDKMGSLMYNSSYKDTIISHCEDVYTETEEEDELLDEAIEAVSNLNYPQFAEAMNDLAKVKDIFIRRQKRINNYKETFTDYTEKTVEYDQGLADAYNAESDESIAEAYDYTPLSVVEPWETECAEIWRQTCDTESMIDYINDVPSDANVWSEETAESMAIIYIYAYKYDSKVKEAFDNRFCEVTYKEKTVEEDVVVSLPQGDYIDTKKVTYGTYTTKTNETVIKRMEPYMDKYDNPEAWTALNEEVQVTIREVGKAGDGNPEGYTTISVSYDEKGRPVTTVSVTDANGNVLGSTSVSEHNVWDDIYGKDVVKSLRDAGWTEQQLDEYLAGDGGLILKGHNPYYQMTDQEEKDLEKILDEHWEEHPEEKEYCKCMASYEDHGKSYGMTFEEWYTYETDKAFDQETYERAKFYTEIEHKTSEFYAFCDGFTQTPDNLVKLVDKGTDYIMEKLGLDDLFVPDEHDLKIQQFNEEMEQMRDWERLASQTQHPGLYAAGHVTERVATTFVTMKALGLLSEAGEAAAAATELGEDAVVETVAKAGEATLANYVKMVACDTATDAVTDTLPEMIDNLGSGMSLGDAALQAGKNLAENVAINAAVGGMGFAIDAAKAASDAADTAKALGNVADTAKTLDNVADTAKVLDNAADTVKTLDNAADAAKAVGNVADQAADAAKAASNVADHAADAAKAASNIADHATDAAKTVNHAADAAKTTNHAADAAKTADHAADAAKTADQAADAAKTADKAADAAKTADHAADAARTADHAADAAKTADHAADAAKTADQVADAAKTADHAADAAKTADHAADAAKTADHAADAAKTADQAADAAKKADQAADAAKTADQAADAAKTADNAADAAKTADHAADAAKTADQAADAAKTADNAADVAKTADNAADAAKTADHTADAAKTADNAADAEKSADTVKTSEHATEAEKTADHSTGTSKADDHGAESAKTADDEHRIVVESYNELKKDKYNYIPGQKHHINQNAVYKKIVPRGQGLCTKLKGNIFTDIGSAHRKAHESLEGWWNQFRHGGVLEGTLPTDLEYSKAAEQSLIEAGYSAKDAHYAVERAKEQLAQWRLLRAQEKMDGIKFTRKQQNEFLKNVSEKIEEAGGVDEILKQYKVPRIPDEIKNLRKAK